MLLLLNILKKEEFGYLLKSWHPVPSLHGKQMSGNGDRLYMGVYKITTGSDYSHEIKRCLLLLESIKQDQELTVAQMRKSF